MKKAIDDPDLDVTADHVLILRNAGPQGGPGMPEWGMLPIPTKLVKQGVRDMVRLSDARMSGTSYGACILHVSPESYIGGPLALVRNGDMITLDVDARTINLDVSGGGAGKAPRRMEAARAALRARLWLDVHQAHQAGQRRLRLRLPARPISARRSPSRRSTEPSDRDASTHPDDARLEPTERRDPQQAQDRLAPPPSPPRCSSAAFATR